MTQPQTHPVGLKLEAAMASTEINIDLVCPLRTPIFPPEIKDYDPKRHNRIQGAVAVINHYFHND